MIDEKLLINYLGDKSIISIPRMQIDLGIGYSEASAAIKGMVRSGLAVQSTGIDYVVNCKSIRHRQLSDYELDSYAIQLTGLEIMALNKLVFRERRRNDFDLEKDGPIKEKLDDLCKLGLVHTFEGKFCLSVDCDMISEIRQRGAQLREWHIALVANPIICNMVRNKKVDRSVLENMLIPEGCAEYLREQIEHYEATGIPPVEIREAGEQPKESEVVNLVMEGLMKRAAFMDKDELDEQVKDWSDAIRKSAVYPLILKKAVTEVFGKVKKMSLADVEVLIAQYRGDFDDDDEEDDDDDDFDDIFS